MDDKDLAKEVLKTFVHSDVGDAIVVTSLKSSIDSAFSYLRTINRQGNPEYLLGDYNDNVQFVRAAITVLKWYSVDNYEDLTIQVNNFSKVLENYF